MIPLFVAQSNSFLKEHLAEGAENVFENEKEILALLSADEPFIIFFAADSKISFKKSLLVKLSKNYPNAIRLLVHSGEPPKEYKKIQTKDYGFHAHLKFPYSKEDLGEILSTLNLDNSELSSGPKALQEESSSGPKEGVGTQTANLVEDILKQHFDETGFSNTHDMTEILGSVDENTKIQTAFNQVFGDESGINFGAEFSLDDTSSDTSAEELENQDGVDMANSDKADDDFDLEGIQIEGLQEDEETDEDNIEDGATTILSLDQLEDEFQKNQGEGEGDSAGIDLEFSVSGSDEEDDNTTTLVDTQDSVNLDDAEEPADESIGDLDFTISDDTEKDSAAAEFQIEDSDEDFSDSDLKKLDDVSELELEGTSTEVDAIEDGGEEAAAGIEVDLSGGMELELEGTATGSAESAESPEEQLSAEDDGGIELDLGSGDDMDLELEGSRGEEVAASSAEVEESEGLELDFGVEAAVTETPSAGGEQVAADEDAEGGIDFNLSAEKDISDMGLELPSSSPDEVDETPDSMENTGLGPQFSEQDLEYITKSATINLAKEDEDLGDTKVFNINDLKDDLSSSADSVELEIPCVDPDATKIISTPDSQPEQSAVSSVSGIAPELYNRAELAKESAEYKAYYEDELVKLQATIQGVREDRQNLLDQIETLKTQNQELKQDLITIGAEVEDKKIELTVVKKRFQKDIETIKYNFDLSLEKKNIAEEKTKKFQGEFERLNKKVRVDFQKIQAREKQLENQLELLKVDSVSQLQSRDNKILDLKRNIDSLEFDLDNIAFEESKVKNHQYALEDKLERVMKTLRMAINMLDDEDLDSNNPIPIEKKYFKSRA
ncbi:MAG: hypothetical protein HOE90_15095 [Bacteriovoracaceae bacterium]|jgi:hypothetical protein|nr:hypothetical protein [Bacteriovoracaceae bacterium]